MLTLSQIVLTLLSLLIKLYNHEAVQAANEDLDAHFKKTRQATYALKKVLILFDLSRDLKPQVIFKAIYIEYRSRRGLVGSVLAY